VSPLTRLVKISHPNKAILKYYMPQSSGQRFIKSEFELDSNMICFGFPDLKRRNYITGPPPEYP